MMRSRSAIRSSSSVMVTRCIALSPNFKRVIIDERAAAVRPRHDRRVTGALKRQGRKTGTDPVAGFVRGLMFWGNAFVPPNRSGFHETKIRIRARAARRCQESLEQAGREDARRPAGMESRRSLS